MRKPELLAPVGNMDCLISAIEAGCDAVYLSGKLYGARSYAGNFSNDDLIKAIKYSHLYGVKVYVTINTLIYDSEVNNFIKFVDFLYVNNVDAVIIQDIGMFDLIRKKFPNLELHVSTQMHIHNLEGTKLMEELGASRVVLARETPVELIKDIKENTNIELEIFVHGALCISYSGQCLMSSLIGGRSGNRGTCAQCCRQSYDLYENQKKVNDEKYLLSTKDLNTLENIGKLIDIGVDSFKIEGRMKRPEYVYLIISMYRKAIDNYIKYKDIKITSDDIKEIKKIFNRKFTKGFLFNAKNEDFINSFRPNHQGIEIGKVISIKKNIITIKLSDELAVQDGIRFIGKEDKGLTVQTITKNKKKVKEAHKNDVIQVFSSELPNINDIVVKTTDINQLKQINQKIQNRLRKIPIKIFFVAHLDSRMKIIISDDLNNVIEVESKYFVEASMKSSTERQDIIKQLNKLGDTIFVAKSINIEIDENIFIPIKFLNELRREAISKLENKRIYSNKIEYGDYSIELPNFEKNAKKVIYTRFYSNKLLDEYDEVIVDYKSEIVDDVRFKLPRVQEKVIEIDKKKLMICELGSLYKYKNRDIVSDFSLNVTNSYSVALLHSLGVKRVTLSHEMNESQIVKLISKYKERYKKSPNLELIIKDTPEVMVLKYDLLNGIYDNKNSYYLKDRYNNKFPVIRDNNLTYIYNFKLIEKHDTEKYHDIGINYLRENSIL